MKNLTVFALALLGIALPATAQQSRPAKATPPDSTAALLGEWSQYATKWSVYKLMARNKFTRTDSQVVCKACPRLVFKADHTGQFKFADGRQATFAWQLAAGRLTVLRSSVPASAQSTYVLGDGVYRLEGSAAPAAEIALVDSRGASHILRK